jgi:hypothetical protein
MTDKIASQSWKINRYQLTISGDRRDKMAAHSCKINRYLLPITSRRTGQDGCSHKVIGRYKMIPCSEWSDKRDHAGSENLLAAENQTG